MSSVNVGILTFHDAANYGAVLQAYALQKSLQKLDANVEIIDYQADFIKKSYNPYDMSGNKIKALARLIVYSKQLVERNRNFSNFGKKFYRLSNEKIKSAEELKEYSKNYRTIICGSDQIWNLDITEGDTTYYLPFDLGNTIKASYAGSFGNFDINRNLSSLLPLKDFKYGSCREYTSTKLINELIETNFESHVDPTILLNKEEWNEVAEKDRIIDEPYVLIYTVKDPKNLYVEAINFAKKNGYRVVQIKNRGKQKEIEYLVNKTPSEFLSLFRDAQAVFTNSFHGTVFSLIFEKQFLCELYASDGLPNTRSQALLKKLEVSRRYLEGGIENLEDNVDWFNVKKNIEKERKKSTDYLSSIVDL